MKRIVVLLLSFLLLVFVSISASGNNAFASGGGSHTPPPLQVVNLVCGVSGSDFNVIAFSNNSNISVSFIAGDPCAADIATLLTVPLMITNIQSVNGNVVYTFMNRPYN